MKFAEVSQEVQVTNSATSKLDLGYTPGRRQANKVENIYLFKFSRLECSYVFCLSLFCFQHRYLKKQRIDQNLPVTQLLATWKLIQVQCTGTSININEVGNIVFVVTSNFLQPRRTVPKYRLNESAQRRNNNHADAIPGNAHSETQCLARGFKTET